MKDNLEYRLDEPDEKILDNGGNKCSNKSKNIIIILLSVLLIISIVFIIILALRKNDNKKKEEQEINVDGYTIYINVKSSENGIIKNSFKKGGENYIEELGDINNGNDYQETERNNFDLSIPFEETKNKSNYKTIILHIHGGAWTAGDKTNVLKLNKDNSYNGFMAAAMSHTLLDGRYKEYNIYRVIDEIHAVLKAIKKFLIEKGYDGNKLEAILYGGSSGAHLCLLYSYMIKNPPIPIRFVINDVGPVNILPEDSLTTLPDVDALENIEPETIREAFENGTIVQMNGTVNGVVIDSVFNVRMMNGWVGKPLDDSLDEIFIDLGRKEINKESPKYKELLKKIQFGFPDRYITKETYLPYVYMMEKTNMLE